MRLNYISVPGYIMNDRNGRAMARAIDRGIEYFMARLAAGIAEMNDVDRMDEWRLDEIAWEYDLPWYDQGADIESKRRMIKNMRETLKLMGTPRAVKNVVEAYMGGTAELVESYSPYRFRVVSHGGVIGARERQQLYNGLKLAKNVRSVMDEMTWEWDGPGSVYVAGAAQIFIEVNGVMSE